MNRIRLLSVTVSCLMWASACGDSTAHTADQSQPDPLAQGGSFIAVPREISSEQALARQSALALSGAGGVKGAFDLNAGFYLAINKSLLGQRFFLSSFMRQYFPGAVQGGAARTLGTKIIQFQVQNDKLFVFDASSNYTTSGTFDPQVLLEAYPIVTTTSVGKSPNAAQYIVVDPSAGLNHFNLFADNLGAYGIQFTVDISFLQRFRSLSDGVAWEQVFTGTANYSIHDGTVDTNTLRGSGTLGMALRQYSEGAGYTPTPLADREYYFRSMRHIVPNTGNTEQTAAKWNVHPGMKPIVWKIAANLGELQKDPYWSQYDVYGALKAGIENWNQAFGYQVLKAELADASMSAGDDDLNYVLFDEDPSYGAAFANWRTNPNSGEIRGASVYFSSLWLYAADQQFSDDPGVTPSIRGTAPSSTRALVAARTIPSSPELKWKSAELQDSTCTLWSPPYRGQTEDVAGSNDGGVTWPTTDGGVTGGADAGTGPAKLTKKQKVEAYLTHVLVHEIGHTLGLRHNFKGSMTPPSNSVMEYVVDSDAIYGATPQAYDVSAIKYLYGQTTQVPTQAFCTDEDTVVDPDCTRFDQGADPLTEYYGKNYTQVAAAFLSGRSAVAPNVSANNLLKYIRAGTPAQAQQAWSIAFAGISAPISRELLGSSPVYGQAADFLSRRLLTRMWLDPAELRGTFTADPPRTAALVLPAIAEAKGTLVNVDGVRTFASRRAAVDLLKYFQTTQGLQALSDSRTQVNASLAGLTGTELLLTQDLLARIDAAMSPYFEK